MNLSHPQGTSIYNGVVPELCTLSHTSIDSAAAMVLNHGQGAWLAKVDIAEAYRLVPLHSDDCWLLGMKWKVVCKY